MYNNNTKLTECQVDEAEKLLEMAGLLPPREQDGRDWVDNPPQKEARSLPLFVNASRITPRPIPWLIENFLVRGALNGIRGLPNSGKSWLTCTLARAVADGGYWLSDNGDMIKVEQGQVLLANFDDDAAYTIIPRLKDCQTSDAGLKNISVLDRAACRGLSFSDNRLTEVFEQVKPDLAIFDTLQHFIGEKSDMNKANEMNAALVNVQCLAERYNTAVVVIEHISKNASSGNGGHSLNWGLGSTAIPGLMRTAWTVGELRKEDGSIDTKAIICSKYNLMKSMPPAKLFQIKGELGGVLWCGVDENVSPFDLIVPDKKRGRPADASGRAEQIISDVLRANNNEMFSDELQRIVIEQGISERTYKRARTNMGLKSKKIGDKWYTIFQQCQKSEDVTNK